MRIIIIVLLFGINSLQAQKEIALAYIETYRVVAMQEMQRTGVPAAITLAQGILESGMGQSVLCKKSNNHFGIKCKTEWLGEKVYHDDDESQECFRKYNNAEESFKDHSDFLKNRPYYTALFKIDVTDYVAWSNGLKACGYATEKNYPEQLIKIITDYNLNQYTLFALNNTDSKTADFAKINQPADTTIKTIDVVKNSPSIEPVKINKTNKLTPTQINIDPPKVTVVEEEKEEEKVEAKQIDTKPIATSIYPKGVFNINNSKVVWAEAGTSVLALALDHNISLAKIFEFNDISEIEFIDVDRLLFLEKKQKRGAEDFYIVQQNETLYTISQKLGIQLQTLADLNSINKKLNPLAGEKLWLKNKAPMPPKASLAFNTSPINNIK